VEGSLKRLGTDYIDILLLHRPDPLVEPQEVAEAFDKLHTSGKVRFFGVSNHSPAQIELLKKSVAQPLVVNQLELNVVHNQLIDAGTIVNQEELPRSAHGAGTLEYCRLNGILIQAWSPVAHGKIDKAASGQGDERMKSAAAVAKTMAAKKGVSIDAILFAWLLRHPAGIQPIIGTTSADRIKDACSADAISLTREEWYELFTAGRGAPVA
jgi:predicted oxidoreductase